MLALPKTWENVVEAAVPADERSPERAFRWFLENRQRLFPLEEPSQRLPRST